MKKLKKLLNRIFIDGLSGMALGLFSTLIVGTILQQLGNLLPGAAGGYLYLIGKMAAAATCAGIGVGVAAKFKETPLVTLSAATAGLVGGYAGEILSGAAMSEAGAMIFAGPGEPLGAFVAAYIGIEAGRLVAGKTKVDILATPLVTILAGSVVGLMIGPPISGFMAEVGAMVSWGVEQQPFLMGIVVSVLMGMILTLPISSAAIGVALSLNGLAAGAATVGCCCQMVGFAVASFRENRWSGLVAQGVGTSMLQIPNIIKKPVIWLPATLASAILGPVGTLVFRMESNATGSGMGTAGFVGQLMTWQVMSGTRPGIVLFFEIALLHFVLPAAVTLLISEFMRKKGWIKEGDMLLGL